MSIQPNGFTGQEGKCMVYLDMIALPESISKIRAKYQMNIEGQSVISDIDDFAANLSYRGLIMGSFQDFQKMESLRILFQVDIMNVYDEDGKDITDSYSFTDKQPDEANDVDDEAKQTTQPRVNQFPLIHSVCITNS